MSKTYQDEKNELLDFLLKKAVYPHLSRCPKWPPFFKVEFFVTSTCNKNCEYCYLQKYEKQLYPQEFNTPEHILNNARLILDYFIENHIALPQLDIFSGELVGTPLFYGLMDIILEKSEQLRLKEILIPTNASFLNESDEYINKVQQYIDLMSKQGIRLILSLSDDGYILDEVNRPLKTGESQQKQTNDYYDKMAVFAKRNNCGFHPMVNAHNIQYWCKNLDWWVKYCEDKMDTSFFDRSLLLEVRNDEWTDEAIIGYIDFFKRFIEASYESFHGKLSIENYLSYLLEPWNNTFIYKDGSEEVRDINPTYAPYKLRNQSRISCSYTQNFCIRLGDLAICPCHRLSYDHLIIGKYNVENNKIVGVTANNVQTMINNYIIDSRGTMKCDTCVIKDWCLKGCHGAQYEICKDINYPIQSVCNLEKVKAMYFMINMLYWCNQPEITIPRVPQMQLQRYLQTLNDLEQDDKEFYNKWKTIIYQKMLKF